MSDPTFALNMAHFNSDKKAVLIRNMLGRGYIASLGPGLLLQHVKPLVQGDLVPLSPCKSRQLPLLPASDTLAEHVVINFLKHLEEDAHVGT